MTADIRNQTSYLKHSRWEAGLVVEPFLADSVMDLKLWGRHTDPRYSHYDFSLFKSDEIFERWYKLKTSRGKKLFAIKTEDRVRGFISLRDFNIFKTSATMGIVMDPTHVARGLGQRALRLFFEIYFEDMNCRTLKLKVSNFNTRAKHVYEKLGFACTGSKIEPFENQVNVFPLLLEYDHFIMIGNEVCTLVSSYELSLNQYKNLKNRGT